MNKMNINKRYCKKNARCSTLFTRSKNYLDRDVDSKVDCNLDRDPEGVPVYSEHSLIIVQHNKAHHIVVHCSVIVTSQSIIWIKIILITIQIECLHGTKFLDPDSDLDCDLDNFGPCKRGIRQF